MVRSFPLSRIKNPLVRAEIAAFGWELFSALLFASAVVPASPGVLQASIAFLLSMVVSAIFARAYLERGPSVYLRLALIRVASWMLSALPVIAFTGLVALIAAFSFGVMATSMRLAIYRRVLLPDILSEDDRALLASFRPRLTESATTAGIVGGHVMLLFSVAFLLTKSDVMFRAWFQVVPFLALVGTLGFALALRPLTRRTILALKAGPEGDRAVLVRGLRQVTNLPSTLAYLNFSVWFVCSLIGGVSVKAPAIVGDAIMQLGFGALFSWGVSFYQRAWHRETCAPVIVRLSHFTGIAVNAEPITLQQRLMRDFGLPMLFMGALSLFSSIGLYRALAPSSTLEQDIRSTGALFASFSLLILAVGGVVARAARELSRPMIDIASRADLVAKGNLDAMLPPMKGPIEVVGLSESIERMREALARTISELSHERAGLEANVSARTAELSFALSELKRTQAALIQGERLASIGELVSGVAHEIYNPLNAIAGAAAPLGTLSEDLGRAFQAYKSVEHLLPKEELDRLQELRAEVDLDAALEDLVGISTVVRRAVDRSVKIVANLKNFARSAGEAVPSDVMAGLDETLSLLAPRLRKAGIHVVKEDCGLPPIVCRIGEVNQVFMNLLVNAIYALEDDHGPSLPPQARSSVTPLPTSATGHDSVRSPTSQTLLSTSTPPPSSIMTRKVENPTIRISTAIEGKFAVIAIADNGPGISIAIARKIFDPFFTTKPRGQGTGLGLSISTDIVRRHGGTLTYEPVSEAEGACFVCRLPIFA